MSRLFDIILSLIALTIFAIPISIIAFLLQVKEKNPVLFRQQRIGFNKKPFVILKFQTIVNGVPTPVGRILRKTGLDELPQFINVLRGDMSIVGPRALTDADIKRLGWDSQYYASRWDVKPGITGLAQLYGGQHRKTSWFFDKKYLEHRTWRIDIALILASFLMNLFGKTRVRKMIWPDRDLK
ncbi:MAG: sugar transferase [Candidatus Electronema sp. V4]|uniref:sugar transferase n=1 Tax=Candidatus Electronema sp. V4 TaxID=3454756 RepID=UPI00405557B2